MDLTLRRATEGDLDELAIMNKQLIEDEGSRNPMNREQLADRMRGWHREDWRIDLICLGNAIAGYALYRFEPDPYQEERQDVYLRQYFIKREFRNRGIGRQGIRQLMAERFQGVGNVMIEVLESNPDGKLFWEKAGFQPYSTTMKRA